MYQVLRAVFFLSLSITAGGLSVFIFLLLSICVNLIDFYRQVITGTEYEHLKKSTCTRTHINPHADMNTYLQNSFLEPSCIAEPIQPPIECMYLHPPRLVSGMSACWPGILVICYHLAHFPSPLKNQLCLIPGCVCSISPCRMGVLLSHRLPTC